MYFYKYKYPSKKWDKEGVIFVGLCRNCGKLNKVNSEKYFMYCNCGKNIIWNTNINHLNIEVVFRNKLFNIDSVKNFSKKWK